MGLFENFPYTNFHELNLDWIIQKLKEQGMNAVLSVNGQTGDVILYEHPYVEFPEITNPSWKIFRTANGKEVGVYFANDHMYFVDGAVISQVYTENDPPAFPVTSVNGQTGAVQLYEEAGIRFPNVPDAYFNMRRQINTGDADQAIVGLEVNDTGAKRIKDNLRYDIYDTGNPPPYPVSSVNGQTGAVILAIPFNAPLSDSTWIASQASSTHQAGMARQTMDGTVSMYMTSDANHAEAFVKFTSADEQTTYIRKLLTTDDIPSGAGVVSVNGLSGVVLITGEQINTNALDGETINHAIQDLKAADTALQNADAVLQNAIGYVCNGNTCAASFAAGQYVILKNSTITGCADGLYTAAQAIPANTAIDATYLTAVTGGAANSLSDAIAKKTGTVSKADSSDTLNIAELFKRNDIVYLNLYAIKTTAITQGGWTSFGVLPSGFRPTTNPVSVMGVDNTHDIACSVQITTNGDINVYGASPNANMKTLKLSVMFAL